MAIHSEAHPLAGKTVTLNLKSGPGQIKSGDEFRIEDWWDRVSGGSWMNAVGNFAALNYAMRSGLAHLPIDDNVVYGKVGFLGHIVHVSELGSEVAS